MVSGVGEKFEKIPSHVKLDSFAAIRSSRNLLVGSAVRACGAAWGASGQSKNEPNTWPEERDHQSLIAYRPTVVVKRVRRRQEDVLDGILAGLVQAHGRHHPKRLTAPCMQSLSRFCSRCLLGQRAIHGAQALKGSVIGVLRPVCVSKPGDLGRGSHENWTKPPAPIFAPSKKHLPAALDFVLHHADPELNAPGCVRVKFSDVNIRSGVALLGRETVHKKGKARAAIFDRPVFWKRQGRRGRRQEQIKTNRHTLACTQSND